MNFSCPVTCIELQATILQKHQLPFTKLPTACQFWDGKISYKVRTRPTSLLLKGKAHLDKQAELLGFLRAMFK